MNNWRDLSTRELESCMGMGTTVIPQ